MIGKLSAKRHVKKWSEDVLEIWSVYCRSGRVVKLKVRLQRTGKYNVDSNV